MLRFLRRHPWQAGLAILGIALGVAVVVAVDLANASAGRAFELSTEALAGRATHQIVGGPGGLPDGLFRRLVVGAGVRPAAPEVEGLATVGSGDERRTLRILGVDPFSERDFRPELAAGPTPGGPEPGGSAPPSLGPLVTRPGAALLAAGTARELGLAPGRRFPVEVAGRRRSLLLVGLLEPADERSREALSDLLVLDVASAQELLGKVGRLDRIELVLPAEDEAAHAELDRIRTLLPPGARIETVGARTRTFREMTRAFRLNLTALSLLALVCGVFLIYNTMTFSVVQRRTLIGTLRTLGVTRRELFAALLLEALLVGAVGTAVGLAAGTALGEILLRLVTRTINDLYFVLSVRRLSLAPASLVKGVALGLGATVAAALRPALEATSTPPRAVLSRSATEARARRAVPRAAVAGVVLLAVGGAFLAYPSDRLAPAFAGLFAVVLGCALLTPAATVVLMALLGRPAAALFGVLGRMAARGVVAALSRTGVAVAALVIAVSVTVGVGVMIGSFRATVVAWLGQTLAADLYVSPPSPGPSASGATLDPAVARAVRRALGVERVDSLRRATVRLPERPGGSPAEVGGEDDQMGDGAAAPVELLAFDLGPRGRRGFRLLAGDPQSAWAAVGRGSAVLVSEPLATRRHLEVGSRIRLPTASGERAFEVAGVYSDFGRNPGAVLLDLTTYRRLWHDPGLSAVSVYAAPGVGRARLADQIRRLAAPYQEVSVRSNRDLRETSMRIFDRTFAITSVLRLLAGLVAFAGVLSALMALQLERARELGVLRANGMTPGQVWQLVTSQTGLMGLAAGLLAVPVGLVLAAIMIFVINRRSFGWTLEMQVAPEVLLQAVGLAVLAALVAGVYPAWRMARTRPAIALREE
jgi:putative ABC transport system permease protein